MLEASLPFPLRLSEPNRELIRHHNRFGEFRYLEVSYYLRVHEVLQLDSTVWELRRYCQWLHHSVTLPNGTERTLRGLYLKELQTAESKPHKFRLMGVNSRRYWMIGSIRRERRWCGET